MASVTCSWTVPADGGSPILAYTLQRQTGTGAFETVASPGASATSYVDNTAVAGTSYGYRVAAVTALGTGLWSSVKTLTTAGSATLPGAPASVTATRVGGEATVSWQPPSSGATVTGYRVSRDGVDSNGYGSYTTVVAASTRSFTFLSLVLSSSYNLSVAAVGNVGDGPTASASVSATSVAPPTGVTGTANSQTQITWSWTPVSGATGYQIRLNGGTAISVGTSTTYVQSGLTAGSTHSFQVAVTTPDGTSSFSAAISRTTPTAAGAARPKIGVYKTYQNLGANADGSSPAGVTSSTQSVLGYEAWLGRKVDYVLEFQETKATDDHLAWPSYMSNYYTTARLGGRRLSIGASLSSRAVTSPPGNYYDRQYTWAQLAAGQYDSVWATLAQRLVAAGQANSILRGPHEFNFQDFLHRVLSGEQTDFINAWRRWHDIVRANSFTGPIHWNPVAGDTASYDPMTAYPGDAYVDVIDLDWYDRWYSRGTNTGPRTLAEQNTKWAQFLSNTDVNNRGLTQWRAIAVARGKGMAFSEWGLGDYFNQPDGNHGGGDNAVYVNGMADFILDPTYPPGVPGGVVMHAFWEHNANNGVQPNSASNPDSNRSIPVPNARAAFIARFGGA